MTEVTAKKAAQHYTTGAHGVTLASPPMAPCAASGGFPLWASTQERRHAAALLRDIAESVAADSVFN